MMTNNNNLTVYKSNKVIEAGYKLSLNEQRLILSCIAKVKSSKPLTANERFEVTAKEFSAQFGISLDKSYQTLKDISEQLFERYVIIDNPDPSDTTIKSTKTRWISAINYHSDAGKVSLIFAASMIPYLSELQGQFTFYLLENISGMTSIYAIRLYELLMQWKSTGTREIEIVWLKKQFEIEDGYERMFDLKKYVIDPAVKDINAHSNYQVAWEQRKTGRKVTHLIFTFAEKIPEPAKKAKPAAKPKAKGKMINGVAQTEIEAKARAGESYEAAAERIKQEKAAKVSALRAETKLPRTRKKITQEKTA